MSPDFKTIKITHAAHTGIKLLAAAEGRRLADVASEVILTLCARNPTIQDMIVNLHGEFEHLLCMDARERILAELEKPVEVPDAPEDGEPHPWFKGSAVGAFQEAVTDLHTPQLVEMLRNIKEYSKYRADFIRAQYEKRTGKKAPSVDDKEA